ncbi:MAG: hypothetical protein QNJ74_14810 [Trichodesmium sp. MO_231.B1]|nr:hypothetical protein [Trichodesmium sp. MO_231.B1]
MVWMWVLKVPPPLPTLTVMEIWMPLLVEAPKAAKSTTLRMMVPVASAKSRVVATLSMVWMWAVVVPPPLPTLMVMEIWMPSLEVTSVISPTLRMMVPVASLR